jgi:UDP-N-acetylglucosamine 4,6-dehydratase (inverting)
MKNKTDWKRKSVLVTGGTGSFGKKFTEIMLRDFHPQRLIIFSRDELKQHEMRTNGFDHPSLRYFIGDVRDVDRLRRAMDGVDYVVHAAALKQVPSCEYNPFEAVKTNVNGAQNVIDAAIDMGAKKIVAISTDKAVNPVNLYGATKLCAEKIFVQGNAYAGEGTIFSCVRYGNVIGSRGSVIPLFINQKKAGRMTITDKRMTRFWITLDQAVQFVLNAIKCMQGGEIFLPKIPSMKILDLTRAIAPECEINIIGIRSGEKLHEVLITEEEGRHTVDYDGMYVILPNYDWWNRQNYKAGTQLPEGFTYASNTNDQWLSVKDLKGIIENYSNLFDDRKPSVGETAKNYDLLENHRMSTKIHSTTLLKKKHKLAN